jgi:hypothetical protein
VIVIVPLPIAALPFAVSVTIVAPDEDGLPKLALTPLGRPLIV